MNREDRETKENTPLLSYRTPEISVMMGVRDPKNTVRLRKAVESILNQSFQNLELLLYDDGSQERFLAVFQEIAGMDSRIRLLRGEKNQGLAYALNRCMEEASGRYLARMDDDDRSAPDRLQKQYAFLETHPEFHWAGSLAELTDGQKTWGILRVPERPETRDFLANSPYIHPTVMFRKEILRKAGGYCTDKKVLQCEDYELFLRLHREGFRGYNLQEPLLQYFEDSRSYHKRSYRRRIREAGVRYRGFRELGVLGPASFPYVMKPLLVGLLPPAVQYGLKRKLHQKGRKS